MRILTLTASLAFAAAISLAATAPAAATPVPAGAGTTLAGEAGLIDLAQYGHHHHHRRHHHHFCSPAAPVRVGLRRARRRGRLPYGGSRRSVPGREGPRAPARSQPRRRSTSRQRPSSCELSIQPWSGTLSRTARCRSVSVQPPGTSPRPEEAGSRPSAARMASRPSVMAAGPGCRMSGDLISTIRFARTAGTASQPGRAAMRAGTTFFPHQEARITSGAAATTASGATMRSFAAAWAASSGKTSSPQATRTSSNTQPMPEIKGSSHSSKYTRGRGRPRARRHPRQPILVAAGQGVGPPARADQGADRADHGEDAGNVAVVEGVQGDAGPDEVGHDVRLQIEEGED